jgi:peptidyl-prolyl cis-trans isomerase A (cyclophilin A)
MARTTEPNSATSEWFINYADNTSLDPAAQPPGYAVFGQ